MPESKLGFFTKDALARQIQLYGWRVGEFSYGVPTVIGEALAKLSIGSYCSIAPGLTIILGNHNTQHTSTYPFYNIPEFSEIQSNQFADMHAISAGNVEIGSDVWFGQNVLVLGGVSIGDGAVIGAHSVVTKDVPSYAIAVGNPARIIRIRFKQEIVDELVKLKWWLATPEKIKSHKELFLLTPEEFVSEWNKLR